MIRLITSKQDKQQYLDLMRYCFNMPEYELGYILQLDKHSYAFGYFQDNTLKAALITHTFTYNLWDKKLAGTGMGAVATYPESRNKGLVLKLFEYELKKQYKDNKLISTLYPFKFAFYKKIGFGSLGHYKTININPQKINIQKIKSGYFKQFVDKHSKKVYSLYNSWAAKYDFGIIRDENEKIKIFETYKSKNIYNYVYFNERDNITGYLKYEIKEKDKYSKKMTLNYISWADKNTFKDILAFLYYHRDQCLSIECILPQNIPIELYFKEPRIEQKNIFSWMVRPINLLKLINLKLNTLDIIKPFHFSVKDDFIKENTGTYYLEKNKVKKKKYTGENNISMPDLASILCGAYTARELSLELDTELFNKKNNNIFLSELF